MQSKAKFLLQKCGFIALIIVVLLLLVSLLAILHECRSYFTRDVQTLAYNYTVSNAGSIKNTVQSKTEDVREIVKRFQHVTQTDALEAVGAAVVAEYKVDCIQLLNNGDAIARYGDFVGTPSDPAVAPLIASENFGATKIYADYGMGRETIAVFAPMQNHPDVTGVICYYAAANLLSTPDPAHFQSHDQLAYYCLADQKGTMYDSYTKAGFKTDSSHNAFTYLYNLTESKSTLDRLRQEIQNKNNGSVNVTVDGSPYYLTYVFIDDTQPGCFVVNLYDANALLNIGQQVYMRVSSIVVALGITVIIMLMILVISRYRYMKNSMLVEEKDPILGCNTFTKFKKDATSALEGNRLANYAVIYMDVNKFTYIKDHFISDASEKTIRHIASVLDKMVITGESYGHIMEDRFVALFRYKNFNEVTERVKIMSMLISGLDIFRDETFTLKVSIGICCVDHEKNYSLQDLIDRAVVAQKVNKKSLTDTFVVYDHSIRTSYLKEAEIESKMVNSLKSNEFKVFFQPKYNIERDDIDGAEALVRWYDPKKERYEFPSEFIPLFEVNGFIAELDRYIFTEVCKFIHESTLRGDRVVPISVNVSCVTAAKPDFLEYYISTKKKYQIADGFLMLEFTESLSVENFEVMKRTVFSLRNNGFECAVDDFGTGYSTFNILKELPLDELKLDKFFLSGGIDAEKDRTLLQIAIQIGKSFHMKVTQEGVETADDLKRLRDYGCDVIQGYCYSKPLMMSDFIAFLHNDTSLRRLLQQESPRPAATVAQEEAL